MVAVLTGVSIATGVGRAAVAWVAWEGVTEGLPTSCRVRLRVCMGCVLQQRAEGWRAGGRAGGRVLGGVARVLGEGASESVRQVRLMKAPGG